VNEREQEVLAALRASERELVELARQLVATPSPNPPGDERGVAELVRQAMSSFGFQDVRTLARAEERPNVVGSVGVGSASLILTGHIDTKPPGDESEWEFPPYEPAVVDGRLHGLGATDMKGAVAAMLFAGRALAETGALEGTLKVLLTADEEAGSAFGAGFLAHDEHADAVLIGEPSGIREPWEFVGIACRGVSCFRMRVRGTQMHSSLTDRVHAVNASVKMAEVLTRLARDFRPTYEPTPALGSPAPTVNPGVLVEGGVFYGVCPGEATFGIDVRTVPGMSLERLRDELEEFLDRLRREDPDLDVTLEQPPNLAWIEPSAIEPRHPLAVAAQAAATDVLGREVPLGVFPGSTDGSLWSAAGIPTIPALGPGLLTLAHRPNEHVAIEEILQASRIYALIALRFLARGAASEPGATAARSGA
jgi:acetylornithine deacetylase/succinyl-diaminopimelate desuccinylase family protein